MASLGNPYLRITQSVSVASSPDSFYSAVLEIIAETFVSPYAALSVRRGSEAIEHEYSIDQKALNFWRRGVQAYLTESLAESTSRACLLDSRKGSEKLAFLAAPLVDATGEMIGALSLVTARRGATDAARKLAFLESVVCFASYSYGRTRSSSASRAPSSSASAQATAHAASCETPVELAFAVTNNLRNKLGCEQVALGVVNHRRVKVLSISGLDKVASQSTGVRDLQAAMEECLDAGTAIACPDGSSTSEGRAETGYRLHQQWRAAVRGDAVASIPLCIGEETAAVLSLRHRVDRPFAAEQIEQIRGFVEPYAAALRLLHNANRGAIRCAADATGVVLGSLVSRGHLGRKIAAVLMAAVVSWMAFGTMDYELAVSAVVKPREMRHVTAPFDGVLSSATALEGDLVTRAGVLCRFDQVDLDQQRAETAAEINVFERKKDQALAEDNPVNYQLALASQKLARAKLDTNHTRMTRCTVRSPIDGIVVSGDLRKSLGSVVQLGDPLFEIAPLHAMVLELEVPEADADDLAINLSGVFASHARPEHARPFRIMRVRPRTEVRELGNMCIVEAATDLADTWMRPGMEGVARVHVGQRAVWWVGMHRILDYLRLNFWL